MCFVLCLVGGAVSTLPRIPSHFTHLQRFFCHRILLLLCIYFFLFLTRIFNISFTYSFRVCVGFFLVCSSSLTHSHFFRRYRFPRWCQWNPPNCWHFTTSIWPQLWPLTCRCSIGTHLVHSNLIDNKQFQFKIFGHNIPDPIYI